MAGLLETLALKALERERLDIAEQKFSPQMVEQAREIVRQSRLAAWFPPVTWLVVDHNLLDGSEPWSWVVVAPDEEDGSPWRFFVRRPSPPTIGADEVRLLQPNASADDGYVVGSAVMRSAVDVGLLVESRLRAEYPSS